MTPNRKERRLLTCCSGLILLLASVLRPAPLGAAQSPLGLLQRVEVLASEAAPVGKQMHQLTTRAEHSANRFLALASDVGLIWLWIGLSVLVFLVVAAVASVIDLRMLQLRHESPGAASRYLGYGMRTFFRIVRDRRTPHTAQSLLAAALVYWVLPFDLLPDGTLFPGFVDDLVIAVSAAKGFMYLCPDALVAEHAAAVETNARRTKRALTS